MVSFSNSFPLGRAEQVVLIHISSRIVKHAKKLILYSGGSRHSGGGPGPKNVFSALQASVWSKYKGGGGRGAGGGGWRGSAP